MIRAKNYETVSKFVKVMTKIFWALFFRTWCIINSNTRCIKSRESHESLLDLIAPVLRS